MGSWWRDAALQPGLDGLEDPVARLFVVAGERDHETHLPVARGIGIASERTDPLDTAGFVPPAVVAVEQVGVGREEFEHFGEAAGGEAVVAADAGALLEMDGVGEAVRGENFV